MSNDRKPNRLIGEKSPYLFLHAYNPVDWYTWGEEAFDRAKAEEKPVFVSIGYSTCHWCHVMERESFEDNATARYLNEHFISVKVDREERPDVDEVYMSVCQALTGSGGWPLSVFVTSDQLPFYAGTYFPKSDRYGMPGFVSLLTKIAEAWENHRDSLLQSGREIAAALSKDKDRSGEPPEDIFDRALELYRESFDERYGGFGDAPKFPSPHNLLFLMGLAAYSKKEEPLHMAADTLRAMYRGGIYDHIGGGFCRYSTDRRWLVPHFEKMLYDNALLAITYTHAYLAAKDEEMKEACRGILDYVLRDMTSPDGGFFSAEDADSEGVEGKFYLWTPAEVIAVLEKEDGERWCALYDITERGNFEGANIPNLVGRTVSRKDQEFAEQCRLKLYENRERRVHPYKDDKILTSWNSLMIAALAVSGACFQDERYVNAAKRAADFLLKTLFQDGRLMARYREGEVKHRGYADDYAFFVWALLSLYDATFDSAYLERAIFFQKELYRLFWDEEGGGLYLGAQDAERLIWRPKSGYDGAIPSASSVAAYTSVRLFRLTGDPIFRQKADTLMGKTDWSTNPAALSMMLYALLCDRSKGAEITVVSESKEEVADFLSTLHSRYLPFVNTLLITPGDAILPKIAPMVREYAVKNGKPTAYVCKNSVCGPAITQTDLFIAALGDV